MQALRQTQRTENQNQNPKQQSKILTASLKKFTNLHSVQTPLYKNKTKNIVSILYIYSSLLKNKAIFIIKILK